MKRYFILAALTLLCVTATAQKGAYYTSPMQIPLLSSGNFAEMRPGHFHSGLDLRTQEKEGIPLYAVADGVLVRVNYSAAGYGRALYIDHPNGTTSVYAHMQRFTPEVERYLDEERYQQQKDQVDLSPAAGRFRFKQGELIGYSGNSGGSGGPHLHFELRETPSQRPLNPVASGAVKLPDTTPPTIFRLFYIQVDTLLGVPVNGVPQEIKLRSTGPAAYAAVDATVPLARNGYFVIEAIDRMAGSPNTMGIYRVVQTIDGEPVFEVQRDKFLFSDTRYVNALAHYGLNRASSYEMIRLAVLAGNKLPMYYGVADRGAVVLRDTLPHAVGITLADDSRNEARLDLMVRLGEFATPLPPVGSTPVRHDRPFSFSASGAGISIPAGVLYEPIFYTQSADTLIRKSHLSPVHRFHTDQVPMHTYSILWIEAENIPQRLRGKVCLARVNRDGSQSYAGGEWCAPAGLLPARVSTRVRDFGRYCIIADTIPPRITADFQTGANLAGRTAIRFTVTDNFSGIRSYRATIDGKWALVEYDPKTKSLTHPVNPIRFPGNSHTITLEVSDNRGNRASFKAAYTN